MIMNPAQLVEIWIEKFNAADIDGLMDLYAEDATNHQVVTKPLVERENVRKLFEVEFARAKMVCNKEALHEAGDWAILEWSDPLGLRGCGFFHIQNDQIIFQRGYFDQLTFFKVQGIQVPDVYLGD
jgi:limonene-1,2-epoxide hydrolase